MTFLLASNLLQVPWRGPEGEWKDWEETFQVLDYGKEDLLLLLDHDLSHARRVGLREARRRARVGWTTASAAACRPGASSLRPA